MVDFFRKHYTPLSEVQKQDVQRLKGKAEELLELYDSVVPPAERSERSRCMNIARTDLEKSVMMAVKGVTTAE